MGNEGLLNEAVDEILKYQFDELVRQRQRSCRREHFRKVEAWLHQIEDILENEGRTVPEALTREIITYLRKEAPPLHRELLLDRDRDAARTLDVLFEAQEVLATRGLV
jgi:hypothetical protein